MLMKEIATLEVSAQSLKKVCQSLYHETSLAFNCLIDLCGVRLPHLMVTANG